jgi:AraC-like DNA-binding protein
MKAIPLTKISTVTPFLPFLQRGGAEVGRHLAAFQIDPTDLLDPEAFVPLPLAAEFIANVARHEGISNIGFEVGGTSSLGGMGEFGRSLQASVTLLEMLRRFVDRAPLVNSGVRAWLRPDPSGNGDLRLGMQHRVEVARAQIDGYALMLLVDLVRMAAGPDWKPEWLAISTDAGDLGNYAALADARAEREVEHIEIGIPATLLALKVKPKVAPGEPVPNNPSVNVNGPPLDLVGSIQAAIQAGFGVEVPLLESIADMLESSPSTVQRRLRESGFTYRDLLARTRYEVATSLLGGVYFSVSDISTDLGYTEPSSFGHGFTFWSGMSPSQYRRSQ